MADNRQQFVRSLIEGYTGPESHKRRLERILQKADFFSGDYGPLAYALAEMQIAGGAATTTAQNVVATVIQEKFDALYQPYAQRFQPSFPGEQPLSPSAYFAKNREQYHQVLSQPLDLGWARDQRLPYSRQTVGELLPSAFNVRNVQEGMGWLANTMIPQVVQELVHIDRNKRGQVSWMSVNRNFADELQHGITELYASIPNYRPPEPGKQNNFAFFAGNQFQHAIRQYRKDEAILSGGKINFGWFSEGSEDGPEYGAGVLSDTNSQLESRLGTYGASGEAPTYEGGIAGNNAFNQKPYVPNNPRVPELVRNALLGIQDRYPQAGDFSNLTRDIFGNYSRQNVQTGAREVDTDWGRGMFGAAGVSAYEYGLDPEHVQVFGIDPNSPAGQVGMKEGAFLTSLNKVLKSPRLQDVMDAAENGHAFAMAYIQPDEQGVYQEYVSVFQMPEVAQNSADQGVEGNWINRLSTNFDDKTGRTMVQMKATWRANGDDWEYVPSTTASEADSTSGIPLELWTTDEKYSAGMYKDSSGNWQISPLSTLPGGKYNTRVYMDPTTMNRFGDLYGAQKDVWNSDQAKSMVRSLSAAEERARNTVLARREQARKSGNLDKFPALETAIARETQLEYRKLGFDIAKAMTYRSGQSVVKQLRSLEDAVKSSSYDVDTTSSSDLFDAQISARPRMEQQWATKTAQVSARNREQYAYTTASERAKANLQAAQRWAVQRDIQRISMQPMEEDTSFRLSALAADENAAAVLADPGSMDTSGASVDVLAAFVDRPVSGDLVNSLTHSLNELNEFTRFPVEQQKPGSRDRDETILGGDPGQYVQEVGMYEPREQRRNINRRLDPMSVRTLAETAKPDIHPGLLRRLSEGPSAANNVLFAPYDTTGGQVDVLRDKVHRKGRITGSVTQANRNNSDPVIQARAELDDQANRSRRLNPDHDQELSEAHISFTGEEVDRDFQTALRQAVEDPLDPAATNAAMMGQFGATQGYMPDPKKPKKFEPLFARMNRAHPENYQSHKALEQPIAVRRAAKQNQARTVVPVRARAASAVQDVAALFGDSYWENESGGEQFDWVDGRTPADRQSKAAYQYGQATGDWADAREMVLYPEATGNTPAPTRNLPHFGDDLEEKIQSTFTATDAEESGFLIGRVNDQGGVDVFDVVKPEQRGRISRHRVRTTSEMIEEANRVAQEKGGFLAGYIHTHPGSAEKGEQYLRPSNSDVLTSSLTGQGSMHRANWGEDTAHVIYNPETGKLRVWNHEKTAVRDVSRAVHNPSTKPARVGLRKDRKVFQGIEARNSFDSVTPPPARNNPPNDPFEFDTPAYWPELSGAGNNGSGGNGEPPEEPPIPWDIPPMPEDDGSNDNGRQEPDFNFDDLANSVSTGNGAAPAFSGSPMEGGSSTNGIPTTRYSQLNTQIGLTQKKIAALRKRQQSGQHVDQELSEALLEQRGLLDKMTDQELRALMPDEDAERLDRGSINQLTSPAGQALARRQMTKSTRPVRPAPNSNGRTMTPQRSTVADERLNEVHEVHDVFSDRYASLTQQRNELNIPDQAQREAAFDRLTAQIDQVGQEWDQALGKMTDDEIYSLLSNDEKRQVRQGRGGTLTSRAGTLFHQRQPSGYGPEGRLRQSASNPADFPTQPKAGWTLERSVPEKDADGNWTERIESFQVTVFGTGAEKHLGWGRLNQQSGEYEEVTGLDWGTIVSPDEDQPIADVSYDEHMEYRRQRVSQGLPPRRLSKKERAHFPTAQENAIKAAKGISIGDTLRGQTSRVIGTATEDVDPGTGEGLGTWTFQKPEIGGSQTTLDSQQLQHGYDIAQMAVTASFEGPLPTNNVNKVATIKDRIRQAAFKQIDNEVDELIKGGADPSLSRSYGNDMKEAVGKMVEKLGSKVVSTMAEQLGISTDDIKEISSSDARLKTVDEVKALTARSPAAKKMLGGRTEEEVWASGKEFIVTDEAGHDYDIGSGGYRRGSNPFMNQRPMNGYGLGGWGSALYGTYMIGREWQMALGQPMEQAAAYGKIISQYAPIALGGADAITAGAAGAGVREELAAFHSGRAASQVFGGFSNIDYMLSGMGPVPGRLMTSGRAALGIGAGTTLGLATLGMSLPMMGGSAATAAALSSAAGPAGLGIGGGLLAVTGAMELYNAIAQPDDEHALTFGNVFSGAAETFSIYKAALGYEKERSGGWGAFQISALRNLKPGTYSYDDMQKLKPYMSEAEWDVVNDQGTPESVKKMFEQSERVMRVTGEDQKSVLSGFATMSQALGGPMSEEDYDLALNVSDYAIEQGKNLSAISSEAMQYAEGLGARKGTDDYNRLVRNYLRTENSGMRNAMGYTSSRWASLSAQWQSTMGPGAEMELLGSRLSQRFGFDTQAEQSAVVQMSNAIQSGGYSMSAGDQERVGQAVNLAGTFQSQVFSGAISDMVSLGMVSPAKGMDFMDALSSAGMSGQDASIYQRMLNGDIGAYSFQAWKSGNMDNAFLNRAGQPIFQTSGRGLQPPRARARAAADDFLAMAGNQQSKHHPGV